MFSQITKHYISDKFCDQANTNIQFTLPTPYVEIYSAATVANIRALLTFTMARLILSLAANF